MASVNAIMDRQFSRTQFVALQQSHLGRPTVNEPKHTKPSVLATEI